MRIAFLFSVCTIAGVLTTSCAAPVQPAVETERATLLGAESERTFTLSSTDGTPARPAIVFDHRCAGVRYVHALRDEIVLRADGTAARRMEYDRFADDRLLDQSTLLARGRWSQVATGLDGYFSGAPSILLDLTSEGERASAYLLVLRVGADGALTTRSPVGGSCPGSANDARHAEFAYTLR